MRHEAGKSGQIARPVDIPKRGAYPATDTGGTKSFECLRRYLRTAPIDVDESLRTESREPEQDVPAILGRHEHRIVAVEIGGCGPQGSHVQNGAIGADYKHARVAAKDALVRRNQARSQIVAVLPVQCYPECVTARAKKGVTRRRRAP